MKSSIMLSSELRRLIEKRLENALEGIEDTLLRIHEEHNISPTELKADLDSLEKSFNLISQKWSLGILYTLFLKNAAGFSEIKNILGVNSRTLSDKLKLLTEHGLIARKVFPGPPIRVEYTLTLNGKNTVLLALPLLYHTRSNLTPL